MRQTKGGRRSEAKLSILLVTVAPIEEMHHVLPDITAFATLGMEVR